MILHGKITAEKMVPPSLFRALILALVLCGSPHLALAQENCALKQDATKVARGLMVSNCYDKEDGCSPDDISAADFNAGRLRHHDLRPGAPLGDLAWRRAWYRSDFLWLGGFLT